MKTKETKFGCLGFPCQLLYLARHEEVCAEGLRFGFFDFTQGKA